MLPVLIAGAALFGLGAHASASMDNSEAKEKNEKANEIIEEATHLAKRAKTRCQNSIDALAKEKTLILQGNMKRFVKSFSQIKPVNFKGTEECVDLATFTGNELMQMQSMVVSVQKVSVNDVVGGASGAALAIGAADVLAGGSILGGTGLTVGGLAGGAALGAIAAPIFAITGIFSASEASANLEKAKTNLAKAQAYQDECETYSYFANSVGERCDLFCTTLINVNDTLFTAAVDSLEQLVKSKRTIINFFKNVTGKKIYSKEELKLISSTSSLAKMMKTILDTNILDSEGNLTKESEEEIKKIESQIKASGKNNSSRVNIAASNEYPVKNKSINTQRLTTNSEPKKTQTVANTYNTPKSSKRPYNPGGFAKFIMWIITIPVCCCGALLLASSFACGSIWIAGGLIMCPRVKSPMKFLARFFVMLLLLFIGGSFL